MPKAVEPITAATLASWQSVLDGREGEHIAKETVISAEAKIRLEKSLKGHRGSIVLINATFKKPGEPKYVHYHYALECSCGYKELLNVSHTIAVDMPAIVLLGRAVRAEHDAKVTLTP